MSDNKNITPENNSGKKPESNNFFKGGNKNTIYIFIAIAVGFFILNYASNQETAVEISQMRFETKMMKLNAVEKVNVVNDKRVEVFIKESSLIDSEFFA